MVVYTQTQKLTADGDVNGYIVVRDAVNLAPGIYGTLSDVASGPITVRIETIDYNLNKLLLSVDNVFIDLSDFKVLNGASLFVSTQLAPPGYVPPNAGYVLPIASPTVLGGIKVGSGLSIDVNGVLSSAGGGALPIATDLVLGGVKSSSSILVDGTGVMSVGPHSHSALTTNGTGGGWGYPLDIRYDGIQVMHLDTYPANGVTFLHLEGSTPNSGIILTSSGIALLNGGLDLAGTGIGNCVSIRSPTAPGAGSGLTLLGGVRGDLGWQRAVTITNANPLSATPLLSLVNNGSEVGLFTAQGKFTCSVLAANQFQLSSGEFYLMDGASSISSTNGLPLILKTADSSSVGFKFDSWQPRSSGDIAQFLSQGTVLARIDQFGTLHNQPYDLFFSIAGAPTADQMVSRIVMPRGVVIPVDCAGSVGSIGVMPTADTTILMNVNGTLASTITVSTGGVFTFTNAAPIALALGDVVTLVAQHTPDATAADFAITLVGVM